MYRYIYKIFLNELWNNLKSLDLKWALFITFYLFLKYVTKLLLCIKSKIKYFIIGHLPVWAKIQIQNKIWLNIAQSLVLEYMIDQLRIW